MAVPPIRSNSFPGSNEETSSMAFDNMVEEIEDLAKKQLAELSHEEVSLSQIITEHQVQPSPQEQVDPSPSSSGQSALPPLPPKKGHKHCCTLF
jgi:hypothetical protein